MKKKNYLLLFIVMFCLLISKTYAITIRETMDENDGYSTLEEGSIIIGVTRFSSDTIVTASKSATAGVNDVMLYMSKNGNTDGYEMPGVYYYVDPYVGWFFLDANNKATSVEDEEELEELSKLDIYYVDNIEKVLEVDFPNNNIDESTLPEGVIFKDNKLFINATVEKIEFKTKDDKNISFVMDPTTSQFIEDVKTCYTVSDGMITSYNKDCGNEVIIPLEINGEKITGIGPNAFKNTNLISIVIPSQIESLGSYSFAENQLENVVIKDKYDESDFSFYGDNVFGEFNNVTYDNELTRMLSYVNSEYIIKYYKDYNIDTLKNAPISEYGLRDYIHEKITNEFKDNGYDFNYKQCWNIGCIFDSYYQNGKEPPSKYIYGIGLYHIEDYKYNLVIEKYNTIEKKVYSISKKVNVSFEETGLKEDYNIVTEAIENLQRDNRFDEQFNDDFYFPTRLKYIQDLEDLYDIKVILTQLGCGTGIEKTEEILHVGACKRAYYLKDDVIYQDNNRLMMLGTENNYYTSLVSSDYENIDEFVEEILKEFVKDTGVNNYHINYAIDGKIYRKGEQVHKTGISYKIELIDVDFSEKWIIEFMDYYEDQYDELGFTKAECFEFDNGVITSYDGTCGSNVKIPNQINGIDVIEIADENNETEEHELFCYSGLRSVVLPNKLKKIGNDAFNSNNITELIIPETVTEIGYGAFTSNKIENIILPDSLTELGADAFENNNIETLKLNNNLTKINPETFANNKIKALEIPGNIKVIDFNAFKNNEIETLIINEGVEIIEEESFLHNKIKSLTLPKTLQKIDTDAFTDNQLPTEESFIYGRKYDEENDRYIEDYEVLNSYAGANRGTVIIPSNVKTIGANAFRYCDIEEIKLPYGLETIGYGAFAENKLTKLSIPNTVTEIGSYAFYSNNFSEDNSFIYMHDESGNIDKTNLIAYENSNYYDLEEIIIPNKVKKIWSNAFSNGTVNNLIIPYGVEEIGDYAFSSLTINNSITLPKSIKKLGKDIFNNSNWSDDKEGLVYARNENGTIDKTILMGYKGYKDYNTDRILTLPEGIVEIRENVFSHKINLKGIILPSTLEKIGSGAFYETYVTEYNIPSSVKSIGDNAFNISYGTLKIFIENKEGSEDFEYLGNNPFGNANEIIYENRVEVNNIYLNKSNAQISIGDTETLILTIEPSDATDKDVKWHSSNPNVATVENGVVTTLSEGTTIISATLSGKTVTCKVTVAETYSYIWEKINVSTIDEYYLYIVNSKGEKVSGKVNITYQNDKTKEHEVSETGLKIVKNAVNSVEIISIN